MLKSLSLGHGCFKSKGKRKGDCCFGASKVKGNIWVLLFGTSKVKETYCFLLFWASKSKGTPKAKLREVY